MKHFQIILSQINNPAFEKLLLENESEYNIIGYIQNYPGGWEMTVLICRNCDSPERYLLGRFKGFT